MQTFTTRRGLLKLGLALPAAALIRPNPAQAASDFPNHPITLILPFPAGGATDTQMRALTMAMSRNLKQSVIVSNRPGAAGTLGPSVMAQKDAPDGYTISIAAGTLFRLPFVQKVSYDPLTDFTYIACLTSYSYGITVHKDAPWKTLADLIEDARANPDKISYGGTGTSGSGHIIMERIARQNGVKFNFIPFKGAADETTALLGGHIQFISDAGWGPIIATGKARLLAVVGKERAKRLPDVPTIAELGYTFSALSPVGIVGPRGMDPNIVAFLQKALFQAATDPEYQRALDNADQPQMLLDSAAYTALAKRQVEEDRQVVAEMGLREQ